jgi:lysophospholipase L1-like esterase
MTLELSLRARLFLFLAYLASSAAARGEGPSVGSPPPGFRALFNGTDLTGWKGLVADPLARAKMSPQELAAAQASADERMRSHWRVEGGVLVFDGKGDNLCTADDYEDFELLVDWKIEPAGDSGIYLRGSPQVQIWDPAQHPEGSGGLFNNQRWPSKPLARADRSVGEWNTFRIFLLGELVTVYLNDVLVVDQTPLENYWDRAQPIFPKGPIELQNHGSTLYFRNIYVREIPRPEGRYSRRALVVQRGDRVAIAGDSITEQRRYCRFIEDYLLACVPDLELRVLQLGWSGERAPGFAARLHNDLLWFEPDVVTICYGMNDGLYRPYEPAIGETYGAAMREVVRRISDAGATVVVGSPGAVDTHTFRREALPPAVYNANLAKLRDIARDIAHAAGLPFANVHDAMVLAMRQAKPVLGDAYHVCGADGFHPDENGHMVMAYAFLKAMGFDGEIGTIVVDLEGGATASAGHEVLSSSGGKVEIESRRYPFCFPGDAVSPSSTRSIVPFVPFQSELNRLTLVVKNLEASAAEVAWNGQAKIFAKADLERGVNLAAEFLDNPFIEAFVRVDELVARKQAFETPMVKNVITRFRDTREQMRQLVGADGEVEEALAAIRGKLRKRHDELHAAARAAVIPVRHTIAVQPK